MRLLRSVLLTLLVIAAFATFQVNNARALSGYTGNYSVQADGEYEESEGEESEDEESEDEMPEEIPSTGAGGMSGAGLPVSSIPAFFGLLMAGAYTLVRRFR